MQPCPHSTARSYRRRHPTGSRSDNITQRLQRLVDTQAGPQAPAGAPAGAAGAVVAPGADCSYLGTGLGARARRRMVLSRQCSTRFARVWRRMRPGAGAMRATASWRSGLPDSGCRPSPGRPETLPSHGAQPAWSLNSPLCTSRWFVCGHMRRACSGWPDPQRAAAPARMPPRARARRRGRGRARAAARPAGQGGRGGARAGHVRVPLQRGRPADRQPGDQQHDGPGPPRPRARPARAGRRVRN
jgi:hypothetical protein